MTVDIIKNILPKESNKEILNYLCNEVSWYIAREHKKPYDIIFKDNLHLGYAYCSNLVPNQEILNIPANIIMNTVLEKTNRKGKLFRFMWNMYNKNQESFAHVDHHLENYISVIYALHTTDGGTEINDKFYKDQESEAKIFKSNVTHRGIGPKKNFVRFNLNIVIELI